MRLSAARGRLRFFYEFSHFNSDCMEIFLEKFQQKNTDRIHIIQLDKGLARMYAPIHTAKKLNIPENIILLFQLPTHLELNSRWKAAVHSAPPYCQSCKSNSKSLAIY